MDSREYRFPALSKIFFAIYIWFDTKVNILLTYPSLQKIINPQLIQQHPNQSKTELTSFNLSLLSSSITFNTLAKPTQIIFIPRGEISPP